MSKRAKFFTISLTITGIIWIFLGFLNSGFNFNNTNKTNAAESQIDPEKSYYFTRANSKLPNIQAGAFLVGDLDTGEIILEKNKNKVYPIASVSKLFTATVSSENLTNSQIAKVSQKALATYGENGGFYLGEKIKVSDLNYPLLLESSNDAAEIIAESFTRENFIERLNQKVQDLKLISTNFSDPSGLSEKNKSTASDLFLFAKYVNTNHKDLLKLTTLKSFNNKKHTWFNNSQFLDLEGYSGGKRGYTDEAKQTALSIFSLQLGGETNRNIGIVLLQSPDRLKDTKSILSYLKKNIFYGTEENANIAWVKQDPNILEEREPDFINLFFGGDIMLDRGVKNSVMKNFTGDYSMMFKNVSALIKKSDIAFANLEGPASDQGEDRKNLYSFRMSPSVIPVLKEVGFSILSVANNHAGDWGRDAYSDTLARLKENEIQYTGGGQNISEAENPVIIEKYGMKIGYLAFTDVGPEWMRANETQAGVLLANNPRFAEIVKNAASKVDYLIVSFHFGEEYKKVHNSRQEYLAHSAIDNGAKIVIGHHPHVSQDTEVYKDGFIAYSLGNFIFDQYFSADTMQGMLIEIKLNKDGNMSITKNILKLSKAFQPETIIKGKEEKLKLDLEKTQ
jgi:poly-gamma-glutamate synthesis protein (capsule biosynthesis protein)